MSTMPRFVLHAHSGFGPTHYDLMIEQARSLATWQFQTDPSGLADEERQKSSPLPCRQIADHRKAYLDYQGPVSKGRGIIDRIDSGDCILIDDQPLRRLAEFSGQRLKGLYELARKDPQDDLWSFRPLSLV